VSVDFSLFWDWIYRFVFLVALKKRDRNHLEDLPYWVEDLWDWNYKIHILSIDHLCSII
jgi:hypothetical protein